MFFISQLIVKSVSIKNLLLTTRICRIYNAIVSQLTFESKTKFLLKVANLKLTTQRKFLLNAIESMHKPFTVEQLIERAGVDAVCHRATVYRDIVHFVSAGVLKELVFQGQTARYFEIAKEGDHHHHFLCEACGNIIDIYPEEVEKSIVLFEQKIRKENIRIKSHSLKFYGVCDKCNDDKI